MRRRSIGRCLRAWLCSVGQRLFADVVALIGAVDVVPLPGDPDVGTIFVVVAVVGLSLLPKSGQRRIKLSEGSRGRQLSGAAFPGAGRRAGTS